MAALTKGRLTPQRVGDVISGPVAGSTLIFAGAMVMRNATGLLVKGQVASGLTGVGVAEATFDNSAGADGDITARVRTGIFRMQNSTSTEELTIAHIGALCYVVDDQQVARTNASGSRPRAGIVADVDAEGVWVRFDEALTKAS